MRDDTWEITETGYRGYYVMSNREVLQRLAEKLDRIIELLKGNAEPAT